MTDYMYNDHDQQETDKLADTPFTRVAEMGTLSGERLDIAIQEAKKIEQTADQRGTIANDEGVIESLALPTEFTDSESWYVNVVGPLAETHDDLVWLSAYDMFVDIAPEPDSDEFKQAAAELNIPNTRANDLVPKFLREAYRVLYDHVTEHDRPMHPHRIESEVNTVLSARGYEQAYRYFKELPGVAEPNRNGPAWTLNDSQEDASAAEGQANV